MAALDTLFTNCAIGDLGDFRVPAPVSSLSAATKAYVDAHSGGGAPQSRIIYLSTAGSTSPDGTMLSTAYGNLTDAVAAANATATSEQRVVIYCADAGSFSISTDLTLAYNVDVCMPSAAITGTGSLTILDTTTLFAHDFTASGGLRMVTYTDKVDGASAVFIVNQLILGPITTYRRTKICTKQLSAYQSTLSISGNAVVEITTQMILYLTDIANNMISGSQLILTIPDCAANSITNSGSGAFHINCEFLETYPVTQTDNAVTVSCTRTDQDLINVSGLFNVYFDRLIPVHDSTTDPVYNIMRTVPVTGLWDARELHISNFLAYRIGMCTAIQFGCINWSVEAGKTGVITSTSACIPKLFRIYTMNVDANIFMYISGIPDVGTLTVLSTGYIQISPSSGTFDFQQAGTIVIPSFFMNFEISSVFEA